jgi:hypothetical protein
MTQDRKSTLAQRMMATEEQVKALEERVEALEAAPRAGAAATAARPPVTPTPPKPRAVLKSAASLMPTMVRRPGGPTGR